MCQSYNCQYGTNFIAAMPTNLYGINDNFDLQSSHVLPALIRKFYEAKLNGSKEVVVWGTGAPRREFLYVDDMAEGCLFLMNNFNPTKEQNEQGDIFVNLGTGKDLTIKALAEMIGKVIGFEGEIIWDKSRSDGMLQKLQDVSKARALGWIYQTELEKGIKDTCGWFKENFKLNGYEG
jgi:GDP-L-fucose synthase